MHPDWLRPAWHVHPRVRAVMTTRAGGVSQAPYASMNLGAWVGDDPAAVAANMQRLEAACGARPVFMKQVHGTEVVRLDHASGVGDALQADASVTTVPGVACAVTVADCLPVLFAAPEGRGVAAAHAGWRGLAAGVLDHTVERLCDATGCDPGDVAAWMGPCIGPGAFEVGTDVLAAFGVQPSSFDAVRFVPSANASDGTPRWWANLPKLALDRLSATGVNRVTGGSWCTVSDAVGSSSRFFSFRRDRVTGRMAAAVWLTD